VLGVARHLEKKENGKVGFWRVQRERGVGGKDKTKTEHKAKAERAAKKKKKAWARVLKKKIIQVAREKTNAPRHELNNGEIGLSANGKEGKS